jgi:hypothetical protein
MIRLRALVLAAALVSPAALAQTPAPRPAPAAPAPASDIKTEMGEIDGAVFRIDVPAKWNGGLVIMNHGYSPEPRKPQPGAPCGRIKTFTDRATLSPSPAIPRAAGPSNRRWPTTRSAAEVLRQKVRQDQRRLRHRRGHGRLYDDDLGWRCIRASTPRADHLLRDHAAAAGVDAGLRSGCWPCSTIISRASLPSPVGPLNGFMYGGDTDRKVQAALDADPKKAEIFRRTTGRRLEHLGQPRHLPDLHQPRVPAAAGGKPVRQLDLHLHPGRRPGGGERRGQALCGRSKADGVRQALVQPHR